jgi:hypothetical protein
MQKVCSNCTRPADFSINVIVSTVGVSNRLQATSRAMLFCNACAHDRSLSRALREAVNKLLTRVEQQLRERSTAQ